MVASGTPGQIIILNGAPRSGKSSIATVIQNTFNAWMNLGVDRFMQMTPKRCLAGIGLRPGGSAYTTIPGLVRCWQQAVHPPVIYDLEVDNCVLSPEACAALIRQHAETGLPPAALQKLATLGN